MAEHGESSRTRASANEVMERVEQAIPGRRLHTGFLESAARYPGAPALWIGDEQWTYSRVEDQARRWAAAIIAALDEPPQRIGVFAYRSEVSYIGVLASLFAGATFVPLNRTFPTQRTHSMAELADLDALFVDAESLPQLSEVLAGLTRTPLVVLPTLEASRVPDIAARVLDRADMERTSPLAALPVVPADAPAYLLFTSGSTGLPKGVPVTHANVVHFLTVNQRRYQLTPDDRLTQTFDQTFDLSVFDMFMSWWSGACLCAIEPMQLLAPFTFLREKGITVWFSVPSVAAMLRKRNVLTPGSMPTLRWSLFCGEALPQATAEAWQAAAPNSIVENLYGPTELTIACMVYRWDPAHSPAECVNDAVPIGQAYEGLHVLVVDEELRPVPPGEVGELCIAGPQTFPGYWRDPEKTAARVFTHAEPGGEERCYYRTGDRVRLLETGNYVYLGRTDHQVKVMGYRVELGEIEAALRREPGVVEAAALGWPIENGTAQGIVAFISGSDIDVKAVMVAARRRLPFYMAPRAIHVLDVMPLNANGKVDRNALRRRLEAGM